jgi:hypothetical protein
MKILLRLASCVFLLTAAVSYGQISGTVWSVPSSTANNVPTEGNVPGAGATELGIFNSSAIMFSGDTNYSLGGFLNSFGDASNITYLNGGTAGTSLSNLLFEFTGSAAFTNDEQFTVFHDDGVQLYVNDTSVLSAPNVTSPINTPYTYTGPSGTYGFDFIYANGPCCNADFQTTLVTATSVTPPSGVTPEPSSLTLLGTGVLAFAGMVRRRFVA